MSKSPLIQINPLIVLGSIRLSLFFVKSDLGVLESLQPFPEMVFYENRRK